MTTKHNLTFRSGKTRDRVVDYLAKHPGATSDVIAEALGIPLNNVSSALNSMHHADLVTRRRAGKCFAYMLKAEDEQRPIQLIMPMGDEIEAMKAKLAELEAFKAEALAKHPDLVPIDYEAYRPALVEFYEATGHEAIATTIENGVPLNEIERQRIDALIAAAKLFPKDAA